jgi:hypothetical protein
MKELTAASLRLMMEAANTSETSVNLYQTTRSYNPQDNNLQPKTAFKWVASDTQKFNDPQFLTTLTYLIRSTKSSVAVEQRT